jgi:hypothetical protein
VNWPSITFPKHERIIVAVAVCIIAGLFLWYAIWARGRVVASLRIQEDLKLRPMTYRIREIPTEPPGHNDGFLSRCEVWQAEVLSEAASYRWDSFTARSTSIAQGQRGAVQFQIGGHEISYTPGGNKTTWQER